MDLVSLGSSVEEEDSPLVFLEKVHQFRERVEEFIKTPLPSVINLSVSPRAAEFLQQHWPPVTIGGLEEAPVPKLCCCSQCGGMEAGVETDTDQDQSDSWLYDLQPASSVVLLGLLLLLAALWVNPVGGASLGFSVLSGLSHAVHGVSSELITCVWNSAGSAYTVMETSIGQWGCQLSSMGEKALQQLTVLFQTLTSSH